MAAPPLLQPLKFLANVSACQYNRVAIMTHQERGAAPQLDDVNLPPPKSRVVTTLLTLADVSEEKEEEEEESKKLTQ